MADVVLVHGAATTPLVWDRVRALLPDFEVLAPARPGTGDLTLECNWLEGISDGAVVFGMSGGATLVLELAARGASAHALIAHEPAAGSLCPELFVELAAALDTGGVEAFGNALYGPEWTQAPGVTEEQVRKDVGMFRAFEPRAPLTATLVTTGIDSPPLRHHLARLLAEKHGYATTTVEATSHFIAHGAPDAVAALVRGALT